MTSTISMTTTVIVLWLFFWYNLFPGTHILDSSGGNLFDFPAIEGTLVTTFMDPATSYLAVPVFCTVSVRILAIFGVMTDYASKDCP